MRSLPWIPGWALSVIKGTLTRGRQGEIRDTQRRDGNVKAEAEVTTRQGMAKGRPQPPDGRGGKETLPQGLQTEYNQSPP